MYKKKSDWMGADLFELMNRRDSLFAQAKGSNDPDRWAEAREFRNMVNDQCKYAKNDYIKDRLKRNEGNPLEILG